MGAAVTGGDAGVVAEPCDAPMLKLPYDGLGEALADDDDEDVVADIGGVATDDDRDTCRLGMTNAGGGCGVNCGGVELALICRIKPRPAPRVGAGPRGGVIVGCCSEPVRGMAPVRGGIAGGGPGGGPRVVARLSVEACDGMRGGKRGSSAEPMELMLPVRTTGCCCCCC